MVRSSRAKISGASGVASSSCYAASTHRDDHVPTELRCLYRGRPCSNMRSLKQKGGLHRLCTMHRQRANETQWRVDERRRQRRDQARELPESKHQQQIKAESTTAPTQCQQRAQQPDRDCMSDDASLSDEELEMLGQLLFEQDAPCGYVNWDALVEIVV